ncbi:MAG: response regulator [Geobacteraceae bacterium]|nr:response regulator [Geobacteraceae bacterium]
MKKIVIIDPSETFIKLVSRTLARMGYEVFHAFDLESGLSVIAQTKPSLVLAEINVPNSKGMDLCEKLCGDPRTSTIPVVIVTTDGKEQSLERAKKAGCSDYLTKPLTVRDIHLMLQRNLPFAVKRQMLRLDIAVDAIIRTSDQTFKTRTRTIGEGGLLVEIDHPSVHTGSQVEISLRLSPATPSIDLKGEVIYLLNQVAPFSPRGVGIKFSDIRKETSELLRKFLEQAASGESEK